MKLILGVSLLETNGGNLTEAKGTIRVRQKGAVHMIFSTHVVERGVGIIEQ